MKKPSHTATISNRRASFDYILDKELIVGMVLTGAEVKAARMGHVQLKGSYVTIKNNELWLINASFSLPSQNRQEGRSVDTRSRKLLAHKKQIAELIKQKNDGLTIVPLKMLTGGRHIKLVIASGRGKKKYDKRQAIKQRDAKREAKKIL